MGIQLKTAALTALLLPSVVALAAEGTFDRTLNVGGGVTLNVSTGSGYIHISPGSDNQVHITGHVKSGHSGWLGGGSPEDHVKQIVANPPIEQSGDTIRVGKKNSDWLRNVSIDYEITTPKSTVLDAGSGAGDLRIRDITGGLKGGTGSGDIEVSGIGGEVSLNTGSGDIRAGLSNPTETQAETGSGSIRLNGIQGPLKAETGSGDIEIQGQPTAGWKIVTGSGSVTLTTGNSHFSLDASTGSGSVHSDPPISTHGSLERHHITGDINGGGATVRVETGSGDVRIKE